MRPSVGAESAPVSDGDTTYPGMVLGSAYIVLATLAIVVVVGATVVTYVAFQFATGRYDELLREISRVHVREPLAGRREHRRNVRALKQQCGEPIEELGADLRRLRSLICSDVPSSATHQMALRQAYDKVLEQICAMLELTHELDQPTTGAERDIERLRIEAMLESRGVVIDPIRRHDQNA